MKLRPVSVRSKLTAAIFGIERRRAADPERQWRDHVEAVTDQLTGRWMGARPTDF
jgi:hypothetical protein